MFTISWTDIKEKFDDPEKMARATICPVDLPNKTELKTSSSAHILIEGDNYPVLYKLLHREPSEINLKNKIDIIYIDPPYNTGNTFTYNDDFSGEEGRHDKWLSFMSRRLSLARELLSETGCIFIAIDQSELYILKLLCDKIFGEENFVNDFMWLHGKGKKDRWSRTLQQHTLCYGKDKTKLKPFEETEQTEWATKNIDNDPRGNWFSGSISFSEKRSNPKHKNYFEITSPSGKVWKRQWQKSREEMTQLIEENKIYWGPEPEYSSVPRIKIFNNESAKVIPRNIIDTVESTRAAQTHLNELLGVPGLFDNPKPVNLITHLLEITNMGKNAVIMDFFAGSGTTLEAVCQLNERDNGNRQAILVQKPEQCSDKSAWTGKEKQTPFNTIWEICNARCQKVSRLYNEKVALYKLEEN